MSAITFADRRSVTAARLAAWSRSDVSGMINRGLTRSSGYDPTVGIAAGICFGIAIVWFPGAWITRLQAGSFLEWQRKSAHRSASADDRPLERVLSVSERMLSLWPVPVAAAVAGVVLTVLAATA